MSFLDMRWDQTGNIIVRAVRRGKQRIQSATMPRIGIDMKALRKGTTTSRCLTTWTNSTVEAVSKGNDSEAVKARFSELSEDQIKGVEAIAMDMNTAFVKATKDGNFFSK